ncbi:hypothetical protein EG68_08384 [Paragonimus skrjabini miyazakii]|uniref:Uncharacterized protein n=1 Tax=Paragonimus skrjabini miyazakii TaxID=59628 RepID=A0A8S9YKJ7_9TREM|nr:hypothetical protein EG68_08384 [Paragonimus skrjabini miyazakii]
MPSGCWTSEVNKGISHSIQVWLFLFGLSSGIKCVLNLFCKSSDRTMLLISAEVHGKSGCCIIVNDREAHGLVPAGLGQRLLCRNTLRSS